MPAPQSFFILPRRVVCASARSDASMAALVRAAAARRGRTEGWDIGKGGAGAGGWRCDGGGVSRQERYFPELKALSKTQRGGLGTIKFLAYANATPSLVAKTETQKF